MNENISLPFKKADPDKIAHYIFQKSNRKKANHTIEAQVPISGDNGVAPSNATKSGRAPG